MNKRSLERQWRERSAKGKSVSGNLMLWTIRGDESTRGNHADCLILIQGEISGEELKERIDNGVEKLVTSTMQDNSHK